MYEYVYDIAEEDMSGVVWKKRGTIWLFIVDCMLAKHRRHIL